MLKLKRIFALFALFLGFYLSGVSFNLNQTFRHNSKQHFTDLLQQKNATNSNLPAIFIEPFDEKEIDEDEQIKENNAAAVLEKTSHFAATLILFKKQFSLPYLFQQNFAFQAPRIILYHSWKYFH
jgi:hypothetical protein